LKGSLCGEKKRGEREERKEREEKAEKKGKQGRKRFPSEMNFWLLP